MTRRTLIRRGALALAAAVLPVARLRADVSPVMATLSRYMAAARERPLPADVLEAVKQHVLDTFAAMVSGSELPPGKAALSFAAAQAGKPVATVAGSTVVTSPKDAALINGVLAHSDETDDSHGDSQSHPGTTRAAARTASRARSARQRRPAAPRRSTRRRCGGCSTTRHRSRPGTRS